MITCYSLEVDKADGMAAVASAQHWAGAPRCCVGVLALFAATGPVFGNVVGVDTRNFNPTTNGLDFVTVQSSETLAPGVINTGFFVNHAVNMLPVFETDGHHRDAVTGADLNAGLGLLNNWDLGISFPQIIKQEVDSDEERTQFDKTGNTEWRFNTKVRLRGAPHLRGGRGGQRQR